MIPLILNTNFIKRIENWFSIGFELESPWMGIYSPYHYKMLNLQYDGKSETYIYPTTKSWNNPEDPLLSLNFASALQIQTKLPKLHQTPTKTIHHLLIHL